MVQNVVLWFHWVIVLEGVYIERCIYVDSFANEQVGVQSIGLHGARFCTYYFGFDKIDGRMDGVKS